MFFAFSLFFFPLDSTRFAPGLKVATVMPRREEDERDLLEDGRGAEEEEEEGRRRMAWAGDEDNDALAVVVIAASLRGENSILLHEKDARAALMMIADSRSEPGRTTSKTYYFSFRK